MVRMRLSSRRLSKRAHCLVFGASILFVGAAAEAQFEKTWLDRALQSAQQLASPWPASPHEPGESPAAQVPSLHSPTATEPLLERPRLHVVPVDNFENPWASKTRLSMSTSGLTDPWDDDLRVQPNPEELVQKNDYENFDLVDPWED